jgi:hypothetical protein
LQCQRTELHEGNYNGFAAVRLCKLRGIG